MRQETRIWWQQQQALQRQAPHRPRHRLLLDGEAVGSLEPELVAQLQAQCGGPGLAQRGLALDACEWRGQPAWALQGAADPTARLNQLAALLHERGLSGPWRDEQLAVCSDSGQRIATIERGAVRPLGIATRAVHLVGVATNGDIWLQQRSQTKATHPGCWDTLMGGMISAADDVRSALARETWEEAGLRQDQLLELRHGGWLDFARPSDEEEGQGYMVERIDWFWAVLPAGLQPSNQDGEVQQFAVMPRSQVEGWLLEHRFTPEAALVLAAYLAD